MSVEMYDINDGTQHTEAADQKSCTVCRIDHHDARPFLNVFSRFEGEQETISTIVEQHLRLDFVKPNDKTAQQCLICKVCWDVVYEFHVLYRMVQDSQINHELNGLSNLVEEEIITINYERCASRTSFGTEFVKVQIETDEKIIGTTDTDEKICTIVLPSVTADSAIVDKSTSSTEPTQEIIGHSKRDGAKKGGKRSKLGANMSNDVDHEVLDFYKRIICETCDQKRMDRDEAPIEYNTLAQLSAHMRIEHNVTYAILRCPICTRKIRNRRQLLQHKEMHLNPDKFRCAICSEVHHNMRFHVRNRHAERLHECEHCGKRYIFKRLLAHHMRLAHTARDVKCDQCNKLFNKYYIDEHKRLVHQACFICECCSRIFKSRISLKRHMETHSYTGRSNETATCTICNAVLKTKGILRVHMRQLHGEQTTVSCKKCGKSMKSKSSLALHLSNVCTERSFPCAACGKQFKQKRKLTEHMGTHTGIDRYKCNFCPQTFKFESQVCIHRKKSHLKQWLEMQQKKKEGFRHEFRVHLIE